MWRQAQQNTCRYIHYFVNSKSIPYQQVGLILWRKQENPPAQFKNKPVESYFFKSKSISYHIFSFSSLYPSCYLQDKEKDNNQPELEIKLLIWD
ncbi:hypothetical protein ACFX14_031973 [Malus domestica]